MNRKITVTILLTSILGVFGCKESYEFQPIESISFPYKFKSEIADQLASSTESWKNQLAAWDYSYIGEYEQMLKTWDEDRHPPGKTDTAIFSQFKQNYTPQNALDYIVKYADTSQIVIINEAHQQPLHRVFTTELLIELYDKGFRYLGLETLSEGDLELNSRKYPVYASGTYSVEPQFGNLIRKALELGYHVFPYETDGNGEDREIDQANNILQQINKDSTGKYLIHCGFAHASEGEYTAWGKAMAGRLLEFSGINPLTINQTEFTERSTSEFDHPFLRQLELKETCVFVDKDGQSFKHETHPEWFDIMVFHPKTITEAGRPNWVFRNKKEKVNWSVKALDIAFPILILAFKENEDYEKAIPADIVHVEHKTDEITLALERGAYKVIIQNEKEETRMVPVLVD